MDVCFNLDTPLSNDVRSFDDLSVNDLANDLTESLNIQGKPKLVSAPTEPSDICGLKKEDQDMCEEPHQNQMSIVTSEKFLGKSSTFPCSNKISISDGEIKEKEAADGVLEPKGHAKSVTLPCQRSISLPTPSNLKSAMKGSREKHGTQPNNNLTVTWAPDVYDPTPTAVSHVVTSNKNQTRSKKNGGKNRQKGGNGGGAAGKPSRGGRGKDKKKQARKYGGSTSNNRCIKSLDDDDRVVDNDSDGLGTDLRDFNVGSPDPHCGSSFLKKNVTKMHFSFAEAT